MPGGGESCPEDDAAQGTGAGVGETLKSALPFVAVGGAVLVLVSVL